MSITFTAIVIRATVIATACGPLVWAHGSILGAQATPGEPTATRPKFEVATIKRNVSGASGISDVFQPDGRYRASNMRLQDLVATAFRVRGFQVVGGPAWAASERFDIEAKAADAASFAFIPKADGTQAFPDAPFLMIRELLEDRFKLVVHRETREGPVYALMMIRSYIVIDNAEPPTDN